MLKRQSGLLSEQEKTMMDYKWKTLKIKLKDNPKHKALPTFSTRRI
jgi:hypothetical protein